MRAEFPAVSESYTAYLLGMYDGTYYPERLSGAGKAVYIERNCEMINKSKYCIVYLNEQDAPTNRKSGTLIAYEYAVKKRRTIINLA